MENVCNVCDGTEFSINAGFYYCDNCGNRITVLQEIESQAFVTDPFNDTVKIKKHKIRKTVEKASSKSGKCRHMRRLFNKTSVLS